MLTEICAEIKNYFAYRTDRHTGDFKIVDGAIVGLDLPTEFFAIFGSRQNNGVHRVSDGDLIDEEFHGAVWIMSPPSAFLELAEEIQAWQEKNGAVDSQALSPFASESFGGYSYSKGAGSNGASGTGWQSAYADRLKIYRRISLQ